MLSILRSELASGKRFREQEQRYNLYAVCFAKLFVVENVVWIFDYIMNSVLVEEGGGC